MTPFPTSSQPVGHVAIRTHNHHQVAKVVENRMNYLATATAGDLEGLGDWGLPNGAAEELL